MGKDESVCLWWRRRARTMGERVKELAGKRQRVRKRDEENGVNDLL